MVWDTVSSTHADMNIVIHGTNWRKRLPIIELEYHRHCSFDWNQNIKPIRRPYQEVWRYMKIRVRWAMPRFACVQ